MAESSGGITIIKIKIQIMAESSHPLYLSPSISPPLHVLSLPAMIGQPCLLLRPVFWRRSALAHLAVGVLRRRWQCDRCGGGCWWDQHGARGGDGGNRACCGNGGGDGEPQPPISFFVANHNLLHDLLLPLRRLSFAFAAGRRIAPLHRLESLFAGFNDAFANPVLDLQCSGLDFANSLLASASSNDFTHLVRQLLNKMLLTNVPFNTLGFGCFKLFIILHNISFSSYWGRVCLLLLEGKHPANALALRRVYLLLQRVSCMDTWTKKKLLDQHSWEQLGYLQIHCQQKI